MFGKLKQFHSNLVTIRAIWANWKSVIQICMFYKYLSKLQQPKSKLGQLQQLHSILGRVRHILNLGTCSHYMVTHHSN